MIRSSTILLLGWWLGLLVSSSSAQAEEPPPVAAADSAAPSAAEGAPADAADSQPVPEAPGLDAELFEDLERDLADPSLPPPGRSMPERDLPPEGPEPGHPSDAAGDQDDPLARVGRRMRSVEERLLRRAGGDETTDMQQQIVADLDELLKQMSRRRSGGGKSNRPSPERQGSRRSRPEPGGEEPSEGGANRSGSGGQGAPGDSPAQDATDALANRAAERPDPANRQELLKDLWGHLPERVREQMLQASMDEFLPKYQLLIEEYFKRLIRGRGDSDER